MLNTQNRNGVIKIGVKLKYHKIRNVPLNVCTAESKIAYELAFRAHISFQDEYDNAIRDGAFKSNISTFISGVVDFEMRNYRNSYDYKPGKYNEDAIQAALHYGLNAYFKKPFIATDFEQIGEAFPANYL